MIKVTRQENHELFNIGDSEIILSGPPSSLRGAAILQNATEEKMFVRDLPMMTAQNNVTVFPVHTTLQPGETRLQDIYYSMDPQTPAGTYEMNVQAGNSVRKVTMIVHENLCVQLSPLQIVLVGTEPGLQHNREILFTNKGNIPVTIPNIKHNTLTDMDLICRNLSQAVRSNGDEGIEKTLDAFTRGLKKDITDWVDVSIREAGQALAPGESVLLHLSITLPKDINKNFQYTGDIRIFDKVIRYSVISKVNNDLS